LPLHRFFERWPRDLYENLGSLQPLSAIDRAMAAANKWRDQRRQSNYGSLTLWRVGLGAMQYTDRSFATSVSRPCAGTWHPRPAICPFLRSISSGRKRGFMTQNNSSSGALSAGKRAHFASFTKVPALERFQFELGPILDNKHIDVD
jgi:hypothetical protein